MKHMTTQLQDGIWQLDEYGIVSLFLVEGEQRALVIDTGSGLGDLQGELRALTEKPLSAILTHGHVDHAGHCSPFGAVMMHPADERVMEQSCTYEMRCDFVRSRLGARQPELVEAALEDMAQSNDCKHVAIADGDQFDLGDRIVEVILTPGHTKGSICLLDHKSRLLFTGDMANPVLLLAEEWGSADLTTYRDSMLKLWERREEYDNIVCSHGEPIHPKESVKLHADFAGRILHGGIWPEYREQGFRKGLFAEDGGLSIWTDSEMLK